MRHRQKVREAIRANVADIIAEEAILTKTPDRVVKVLIRGIKEYCFAFEEKTPRVAAAGKGEVKLGQIVGAARNEYGSLPGAGDRLVVVPNEKTARDTVNERQRREDARGRGTTLEEVGSRISSGEFKEMNLVLKTDVQGSIEAVRQSLEQLSTPEVQVRIIHAAAGSITESDVLLAVASSAVVVGFNVGPEPGARRLADQDGVQIRRYDIIYRLSEDIQKALTGMLEPTFEDVKEATLEVRVVFALGKNRKTAGCYVTSGKATRGARARVLRGSQEIFDGPIAGLRRFKDDVREVAEGYECGLTIEGFTDYQVGDVVEVHRQHQVGV
ncbi:MAG: DUF444 family protein [Chloroflexi bacterium]|nr:DUF444 family protein [Chloroflexota bacterium]